MKELTVGKNDAGQRLDRFMAKRFPTMPSGLIQKYLRLKCVRLNGEKQNKGNAILSEGDRLTFFIRDEFFGGEAAQKSEEEAFRSLRPDFGVVYEDENILLVNKPVGLLSQSDEHESYNTLVNHVKAYLYRKGEYDPGAGETFAPALCNRLDKNTGGIVIAAKNAEALRVMNEKIRTRQVEKSYLCLVHGVMPKESDRLVSWMKKDSDGNKVDVSGVRKEGYVEAVTSYRVLKTDGRISLLSVLLGTGRTHQIRAQMAFLGHPLLGDTKYGTAAQNRDVPFRYQALASVGVTFRFTGEATALDYLSGRNFSAEPFFKGYTDLL